MMILRNGLLAFAALALGACATVGPDYERPDSPLGPEWYQADRVRYDSTAEQQVRWWQSLGDPVLDELIDIAHKQNNSLKIAGLRVLESRAQLGIAVGNRYPQSQAAAGEATALSASKNAANTVAGDLEFTQFSVGVGASWEIDFWGKFRRGIEDVSDDEIAEILQEYEAQPACDRLIELTLSRGAKDNVTALVVRCLPSEPDSGADAPTNPGYGPPISMHDWKAED